MQKSLYLVLFVALLTSRCTTLVFEKPIPYKAAAVDKCPPTLVGQFLDEKSEEKPHLLQEVVVFESPMPHQLFVYEYRQFATEDLKNFPNFEVKNNVLIEHINVASQENQTSKDSIVKTDLLRTETGYQTIKQLNYSLDFKTKTIIQNPDSKDADEKEGTFDMRQQGDTYFLNIKDLVIEGYWFVVMLTPKENDLTINMLSQMKEENQPDVEAIMPLTKLTDDTYFAKPTEAQLEAFLKYPEAGDVSVYKRIKH